MKYQELSDIIQDLQSIADEKNVNIDVGDFYSAFNRKYKDPDKALELVNAIVECKLSYQTLADYLRCAWKKTHDDPNSTTFADVKDESHRLYKCTVCPGMDLECGGYKSYASIVNNFDKVLNELVNLNCDRYERKDALGWD